MRALLLLLVASPAFAGTKKWPACEGLSGAKLTECNSIEFSKARLQAGSDEDKYAKEAQGYSAPTDQEDGRSGASLVSCGEQQNTCIKNCKGNGDCTQKCYEKMTACAGSPPGGSTGGVQGAAPDTYTIEFDDTVSPKGQ